MNVSRVQSCRGIEGRCIPGVKGYPRPLSGRGYRMGRGVERWVRVAMRKGAGRDARMGK